jgi:hypothetical protein
MSTAPNKIAGPPISWGVCEVPGWGYQLPPDRVLTEMREIGLAATELGLEGFLPAEPEAMAGGSPELTFKSTTLSGLRSRRCCRHSPQPLAVWGERSPRLVAPPPVPPTFRPDDDPYQ